MGKCIKLTCNTANGDCWDAKTGDTYFKILDSDFTREERKEHIKRLVSCWNACTQFENPEQDIKKLIEALTYSTHLLDDWSKLINEKYPKINTGSLTGQVKRNNEALSLVKE
jgi:hypothetical protein